MCHVYTRVGQASVGESDITMRVQSVTHIACALWSGLPVLVNTKLPGGKYGVKWVSRDEGPTPDEVFQAWLGAGVAARAL